MSKRNITRQLCVILIGVLLVIILCMCSGCFIRVDAPEYKGSLSNLASQNAKPQLIFPETLTPSFEISDKPQNNVSSIHIVQTPVCVEPMESEEPKTKYYDVPLSEDLQDYIFELCETHNIDPALVIAMIKRESGYKASAVGDKGNSLGLMQIQPRWHKERMGRLNCPDLLDPYQNVTVGIDILTELFAKGKSIEWVLMAYNGGNAYANRNTKAGVVSAYASKVLDIRDNLKIKE